MGCSRPLCSDCVTEFLGGRYCGPCRDYWLARAQGYGPPVGTAPAQPTLADHVVPARNPRALIGYYVSVFSLIPLLGGLPLGPAAVVLGVLGLRARREDPSLPGKAHAVTAIVLGSLTSLANWGGLVWFLLSGGFR